VSLVREYSVRLGILSPFERDLLIKVKLDGFQAKKLSDRHTGPLAKSRIRTRTKNLGAPAKCRIGVARRELGKAREIKGREKNQQIFKYYEQFFFEQFHRIFGYR